MSRDAWFREYERLYNVIAFHGDRGIKAKYLRRVRAHAKADELIQGTGWDDGEGCAVGCTLDNYDHSRYPIELGVPEHIAHLEDAIFEGLPKKAAMTWPAQFLSAIPVGADLTMVWPRFAIWLLDVELEQLASPESRAVSALYGRRVAGDEPTETEWRSAARGAWAAGDARGAWAAWAAWGAGAARAARAARGAGGAGGAWAAREAGGAGAARAARAARAAYWQRCADRLIELLRSAPIAKGKGK